VIECFGTPLNFTHCDNLLGFAQGTQFEFGLRIEAPTPFIYVEITYRDAFNTFTSSISLWSRKSRHMAYTRHPWRPKIASEPKLLS